MPTATYQQLLAEVVPAKIETEQDYDQIGAHLGELIGKGRTRTPEETRLMRLLAVLVEDYDRRNALPPDNSSPAELLQFLMEHSEKTAADLAPVFGSAVGAEQALDGVRGISADEARQLGALFSVSAGLFV